MLDLVALDGGALVDHRLEQVAQFGLVPWPVLELMELAAQDRVPIDAEGLEERTAGGHHAQLFIEDQQGLADRVDDVLRLDAGATEQAVEVVEVHPVPHLGTQFLERRLKGKYEPVMEPHETKLGGVVRQRLPTGSFVPVACVNGPRPDQEPIRPWPIGWTKATRRWTASEPPKAAAAAPSTKAMNASTDALEAVLAV